MGAGSGPGWGICSYSSFAVQIIEDNYLLFIKHLFTDLFLKKIFPRSSEYLQASNKMLFCNIFICKDQVKRQEKAREIENERTYSLCPKTSCSLLCSET